MRKKLSLLLIVFILLLAGCAKSESFSPNSPGNDNNGDSSSEEYSTIEGRKVTYKISADLIADNLDDAVTQIHNDLDDGWFDEERISDDNAYLVVRVRSSQLDDFINDLKKHTTVKSYHKTATDISLTYQETQLKIDSYEAELARLIELKARASMSELITINSRISDVEKQLLILQNKINQYDQLVDYSVVTLRVYISGEVKDERSFGEKVVDAFVFGAKGLFTIVKFLLIVVAAILPFAAVGGPIALITIRIQKRKKRKANNSKNNIN